MNNAHNTGFPDFERLEACLNFLSVRGNGENVRTNRTNKQKKRGQYRILTSEDPFMILLMT